MPFVPLIVDVGAISALIGCVANRVVVMQEKIVEAAHRPDGGEKQGEKHSPDAPEFRFFQQMKTIVDAKVKTGRDNSVKTKG